MRIKFCIHTQNFYNILWKTRSECIKVNNMFYFFCNQYSKFNMVALNSLHRSTENSNNEFLEQSLSKCKFITILITANTILPKIKIEIVLLYIYLPSR
jgi:hypothetical protein